MRAGVHPPDRTDGFARPDQQNRRCDPRVLPSLGDLGGRKCRFRWSVGRRADRVGWHPAFRLAVVRGVARYHPGPRRLRCRPSLPLWRARILSRRDHQ